jgi:hypothetical protein
MLHQPNFKKILNSESGKIVISALLGLGLATLFQRVCNDKNCILFHGPVISEVEGKIFNYGEKCYKYTPRSEICDSSKRIIDISHKEQMTKMNE